MLEARRRRGQSRLRIQRRRAPLTAARASAKRAAARAQRLVGHGTCVERVELRIAEESPTSRRGAQRRPARGFQLAFSLYTGGRRRGGRRRI